MNSTTFSYKAQRGCCAQEINPHGGLHKSHPTAFLLLQDFEITFPLPLACHSYVHHAWGQTCSLGSRNAEPVPSSEQCFHLLIPRLFKSLLWSTLLRFATFKVKQSSSKSDALSHILFEREPEGSAAEHATCICTCTSALN